MSWLAQRALQAALVLLVVSLVSFLLADWAPGGALSEELLGPPGARASVSAKQERAGLSGGLAARYSRWLGSVAQGNLGFSSSHGSAVGPILWQRSLNTLILGLMASILAWAIAFPAGVYGASRPGKWVDRVGSSGSTLLQATPDFLLALGALVLAVRTGLFPTGGMSSLALEDASLVGRIADFFHHAALPTLVLALGSLPVLIRHVRSAMAEGLAQPYVRNAAAQGIPRKRLLWTYALSAAANPLISLFGLTVGGLLSGGLAVEIVLGWPGLGPLLLEGVLARDLHLVVAVGLMSAILLTAANFLTDCALMIADPRSRAA